nr:UvrD-helicase domain-containing protein [Bacteroidota bacterium]
MSFTVYKSSAGSGKTFTLVKEYLKITLNQPNKFRNILAITFTNKAANEMKERIITNLKDISSATPDQNSPAIKFLLPELVKETGLSPETITLRANKVLELILHNYADFSICTIDSFVHRIIRTFAHDLNLPINFEVELDTNILIEQTIDFLISEAGKNEKLTKALIKFTETKAEDEKSWHIEKDLKDFAETLMKEDGQIYLEKLRQLNLQDFFNIIKKVNEFIKSTEQTLVKQAQNATSIIKGTNLPNTAFYRGRNGIAKYFEYIADYRFDKLSPNSFVETTINENKWHGSKTDKDDKIIIDGIKDNLIEIYNNIQDILAENYDEYNLFLMLKRKLYPMAVLSEIEKVLVKIKSENNIVHISEFNKRIADIVLNEPVPFIYERLGERYNHFLLDEFQDTSVLQWQNLLPLLDNSLAEGNFNMIVGDGKQAIYRWRSGEVEQFD